MRAVNHALTGGSIVAAIGNPWSLPLAWASHFVLDALPHFDDKKRMPAGSRPFWIMVGADAVLTVLLLIIIGMQAEYAWLVAAGSLLAISPDIVHLNLVLPRKVFPEGKLYQFHQRIQWSERPRGMLVEAIWFLGVGYILLWQLYG